MKRRFSFLLTAIFLLSVGLCAVTGLSSCENFFNGAELKHEIDDAVAYANAQSCKLYLKSDSASGNFLSEGEKECKVGFTTDIQFTLNQKDYFFVSLEAVSTADEKKSREDCVEFTINQKETDSYRGVYVVTVKVLKYASDILIRPKCMEIPCITSYSPASKSQQFANTPVVINFNVPMEDRETTAEKSLFNYDNISVSYAGEDMSSYFDEPEFNADKTVLTIRPIGAKIKKFIEDNYLNYLDIDFSFSDAIAATNGGVSFPLKQNSNSNFSVRYNSSVEETPPVRGDFFVTRCDKLTVDSAADFDRKYTIPLTAYDRYYVFPNYVSVLVPSTFYIYGKFYDEVSGVSSIEVDEIQKFDTYHNTSPDSAEKISTVYDVKSPCIKFKKDDDGWTSFVLKYTMQESLKENPAAGLFELTVTVKDACDNAAEEEKFCVNYEEYNNLYITKVYWDGSYSDYFRVTNVPFSKSESNPDAYDFDKYYSDLKKIRISDYYNPMLFCVGYLCNDNFDNFVSAENVNYYCEYTDKDGKKRREPFSAFDPDVMERSLVLDIDRVTDVSFVVTVEYDGVCIGRKTFTFPSKLTFEPFESYSGKGVYASRKTSNTRLTGILMHEDGTYNIMYPESNAWSSSIYFSEIPEGCTLYLGYYDVCVQPGYDGDTRTNRYYEFNHSTNTYEEVNKSFPEYEQKSGVGIVSPTKLHYTAGLFGEITGPFRRNQDIGSQPSAPAYTYKLSQSQKGCIDVTLQFPLELWTNFDTILLEYYYEYEGKSNLIRFTDKDTSVSDGKICFTFSLEEERFYNKGKFVRNSFHLTGLKDFMESDQSQNVDIEMTAQQRLEFDSLKPSGVYKYGVDEDRKLVLYFYDNGSGPASADICLNGGNWWKQNVSSTDNICTRSISLSSLNIGENIIEYEVTDKAGNTTIGTFSYNPSGEFQTYKCYESFNASTITFASDTLKELWDNTGSYIKIFKFDESSNKWSVHKNLTKDDVQKSGSTYSLKSSVSLTSNTFYRVYGEIPGHWYDKMICATSNTGDSRYNYVLANGSSKSSVVISSGFSKVLVRLCSTSAPLEVCQNWSADTWDYLGATYMNRGEKVVSVSTSKPTLHDFSEELGYVNRGRCYCLVVHFADGSSVASQVWKK